MDGRAAEPKPARFSRAFSIASLGAFLIAISEGVFMASPFAVYFYSAYSPVLTWTESHSFLVWLSEFFAPHLSTPNSAWIGALVKLPRYLAIIGLVSFVVHAAYLYWTKFVRKGVATALLYRYVRHPQYLSFAVAGFGLVFYWPRFINLLLLFVMLIGYYALARSEERRMDNQHGEQYLIYKRHTTMFIPGGLGEKMVDAALGWLPWPSIHGYVALTMLLAVGLAGSFLLRSASIRNLHYVAMPKALLVFLQEPADVSQGRIENEAVRILAAQPDRMASVPVFYVLSNRKKLRHLLLDSGVTRDALRRASLPDASWYLVEASASYGVGRTIMRSPEEALRVNAVRKLQQVYYAPRNSLDGRLVPYELPENSSYSHARMPIL
jgi:protein-S-isoprenylcysteine O-methyltransferase Ste14